jgi:lysophospholipase
LTSVELPVLVMHGTEDRLASPDGSWFVAKQLGSSDVTLLMYDGLYHEIFNEPEQDAVFDDLMSWLDDHREDEH